MNLEEMESRIQHLELAMVAQQDLINLLLLSIAKDNGQVAAELTNNLAGITQSGRIKLTEEFTEAAQMAVTALTHPDEVEFRSSMGRASGSPSRLDRDTLRALLRIVTSSEDGEQHTGSLPGETSGPSEPDR
ncbi:hypothetical protein [Pseudaeromonas paramecii]|uniref:Uncharacterized protein n=1 Tax=Pseudaeromonas paramecii TaxID=2138166 RepID=A0ABP8PWS6_9GAMM